ncbi:MAG: hypothetical protein ACOC9T_01265 [Myxococcota bacterium]
MPSFDLDDEVGWRDSTEPLCDPFRGRTSGSAYRGGVDLWADTRGVFLLIGTYHSIFEYGGDVNEFGTALHVNDGTGWTTWYTTETHDGVGNETRITGMPSGPVFLWESLCPLRRWDSPTETTCVLPIDIVFLNELHMVTRDEGWALINGDIGWIQDGQFEALYADRSGAEIWGNADELLVFHDDTLYEGAVESDLVPITTTPDGLTGTMWARGFTDVWVVSDAGATDGDAGTPGRELLHFDGADWTRQPLGEGADAGSVIDIWGTDSALYVALKHGLYRWTPTLGVETLLEADVTIRAMHGDEVSGEVYLAFSDHDFLYYDCGTTMVVVYDGTSFRRF